MFLTLVFFLFNFLSAASNLVVVKTVSDIVALSDADSNKLFSCLSFVSVAIKQDVDISKSSKREKGYDKNHKFLVVPSTGFCYTSNDNVCLNLGDDNDRCTVKQDARIIVDRKSLRISTKNVISNYTNKSEEFGYILWFLNGMVADNGTGMLSFFRYLELLDTMFDKTIENGTNANKYILKTEYREIFDDFKLNIQEKLQQLDIHKSNIYAYIGQPNKSLLGIVDTGATQTMVVCDPASSLLKLRDLYLFYFVPKHGENIPADEVASYISDNSTVTDKLFPEPLSNSDYFSNFSKQHNPVNIVYTLPSKYDDGTVVSDEIKNLFYSSTVVKPDIAHEVRRELLSCYSEIALGHIEKDEILNYLNVLMTTFTLSTSLLIDGGSYMFVDTVNDSNILDISRDFNLYGDAPNVKRLTLSNQMISNVKTESDIYTLTYRVNEILALLNTSVRIIKSLLPDNDFGLNNLLKDVNIRLSIIDALRDKNLKLDSIDSSVVIVSNAIRILSMFSDLWPTYSGAIVFNYTPFVSTDANFEQYRTSILSILKNYKNILTFRGMVKDKDLDRAIEMIETPNTCSVDNDILYLNDIAFYIEKPNSQDMVVSVLMDEYRKLVSHFSYKIYSKGASVLKTGAPGKNGKFTIKNNLKLLSTGDAFLKQTIISSISSITGNMFGELFLFSLWLGVDSAYWDSVMQQEKQDLDDDRAYVDALNNVANSPVTFTGPVSSYGDPQAFVKLILWVKNKTKTWSDGANISKMLDADYDLATQFLSTYYFAYEYLVYKKSCAIKPEDSWCKTSLFADTDFVNIFKNAFKKKATDFFIPSLRMQSIPAPMREDLRRVYDMIVEQKTVDEVMKISFNYKDYIDRAQEFDVSYNIAQGIFTLGLLDAYDDLVNKGINNVNEFMSYIDNHGIDVLLAATVVAGGVFKGVQVTGELLNFISSSDKIRNIAIRIATVSTLGMPVGESADFLNALNNADRIVVVTSVGRTNLVTKCEPLITATKDVEGVIKGYETVTNTRKIPSFCTFSTETVIGRSEQRNVINAWEEFGNIIKRSTNVAKGRYSLYGIYFAGGVLNILDYTACESHTIDEFVAVTNDSELVDYFLGGIEEFDKIKLRAEEEGIPVVSDSDGEVILIEADGVVYRVELRDGIANAEIEVDGVKEMAPLSEDIAEAMFKYRRYCSNI